MSKLYKINKVYRYIYYSNKLNQMFTLPIKPPKVEVDQRDVYELTVSDRTSKVIAVLLTDVVYVGEV